MSSYMTESDKECVYVVRVCDHPDSPTVSEDCGINDPVVRRWAQTAYGNWADPINPQPEMLIEVCEE